MKKFIVGVFILFTGCVSIETYQTDIKKVEVERDKYRESALNARVDNEHLKGFIRESVEYIKDLKFELDLCKNHKEIDISK
jgi:hypothetical protein